MGSSLEIVVNRFIYRHCYYTQNLLKKCFLRTSGFNVRCGDSARADFEQTCCSNSKQGLKHENISQIHIC